MNMKKYFSPLALLKISAAVAVAAVLQGCDDILSEKADERRQERLFNAEREAVRRERDAMAD